MNMKTLKHLTVLPTLLAMWRYLVKPASDAVKTTEVKDPSRCQCRQPQSSRTSQTQSPSQVERERPMPHDPWLAPGTKIRGARFLMKNQNS